MHPFINPRRVFLTTAILSLGCLALKAQTRPNVLFIAIDDLVPAIGPYEDPHAITPAMDNLAAMGTTFRNHHCQWPVCGPSRAAMTTSLLPEETNVIGFKPIRALLPDVTTLPQHFRNNGYETAATGKFHDYRTVGTIVDPNSSTVNGKDIDDPASWSIPYVRADDGFSPPNKPAVDASLTAETQSQHGDHKIMVEGKALLDTLEAGTKPFFLAVGFKKPHLPFIAPQPYWDLYTRDQFSTAPFQGDPAGASSYLVSMLDRNDELLGYDPYNVTGMPAPEEEKELIHGYYACVSFIDYLVGELLAHLAAKDDPVDPSKKMTETTIIVLWGDHGFHLGDHDRWAKHSIMEKSSSTPLIIHDPRNPAGGVMNFKPANSIDIYPTLCELAALPVPEQPLSDTVPTGRPLKGRSLVPMLHDAGTGVNAGAISYVSRDGAYGYAFRTERYRYIEWIDGSNTVRARELYDYKLDPLETRNVIGEPGNAAIAYQLSRAMRSEVSTPGSPRLQGSSPIPASGEEVELGDGLLPNLGIGMDSSSPQPVVLLDWPGTRGVTYDILTSATLQPLSWTPDPAGISGGSYSKTLDVPREFYLVRIGANAPPLFAADPLTLPDAPVDIAYSRDISGYASDADPGETLAFAKVDGPDWLSVGSTGVLSGTPGSADLGVRYARVMVSDGSGASDTAALALEVVAGGAATQTDTFPASDDTFAKQGSSTLVPGTRVVMELREEGASNFSRIGYVKITVSGVSNIQSARLHLHSNDETDTINVHPVADTSWTEGSLNWDNRPAHDAAIAASAAPVAGTWFSFDVTSLVTANGTYAFALDEQGNSFGNLDTKEAGFTPYLEIEWTP